MGIDVDSLKVGERLAGTIYCNYSYQILLPKGTVLTLEHLAKLRKYNEKYLCQMEKEAPGDLNLGTPGKFSEQVQKAFLNAYLSGKSLFENISRGMPADPHPAKEAADTIAGSILSGSGELLQLTVGRPIIDYPFSHIANVAVYAGFFSKSLGYGEKDMADLCLAGLLHDVGKARLPEELVKKEGQLTKEEEATLQKHPEYGYFELSKIRDLNERVRQVALQHHERSDSSGYPQHLRAGEISLFSRIIAIVDFFDDLCSGKYYGQRLLPHESAEVLVAESSLGRLDANLVRQFFQNVPLYPVGTEVVLSNGWSARVAELNGSFPLRPRLEILAPQKGALVNLVNEPTLFISKIIA